MTCEKYAYSMLCKYFCLDDCTCDFWLHLPEGFKRIADYLRQKAETFRIQKIKLFQRSKGALESRDGMMEYRYIMLTERGFQCADTLELWSNWQVSLSVLE